MCMCIRTSRPMRAAHEHAERGKLMAHTSAGSGCRCCSASAWSAPCSARELTKAGLKVVGLERGEPRFTVPDFQGPAMHDELRYSIRKALMQDNTKETSPSATTRSETALPIRRWESFLPGTGLGGAAVHWNGQTYRFQDTDFQHAHAHRRSATARTSSRSGPARSRTGASPTAELEPHYDRFEYLLRHQRQGRQHQGQQDRRRQSVRGRRARATTRPRR